MAWSVVFFTLLLLLCGLQHHFSYCKTTTKSTGNTAKKGANILIVNQVPHSPWLPLRAVGHMLAARGHSVTVLMPDDVKKYINSKWPEDTISYEGAPCDPGTLDATRNVENYHWQPGYMKMVEFMKDLMYETGKSCEAMLHHLERLTAGGGKFDLVLSNLSDLPCGPVLARYLGAPSAMISVPTGANLLGSATTIPLVYFPVILSGFTTEMTFMQKVQNVFQYLGVKYYYHYKMCPALDFIVHKYISNDTSTEEIVADTDLWLSLADFNLEFAHPTMPNVVNVAAFNLAKTKPLSEDLEAFMQSSGESGVILFSLGSITASMPDRITQVFLSAFAQLPQKVIWKMGPDSDPNSVGFPPNVRPMSWVPQNDLLAHKKMRLFINHGGTQGLYVAAYHGVPTVQVVLPIWSELRDNTARAVHHGYGVELDIVTMTTDQLLHAIRHVLETKSYKENVERASRIMADQPIPPKDLTMWWIEHVIRHGGLPHLRTRANMFPFYQYFLLDVIAFFVAVVAVVLGGLVCTCRLAYKTVKGKGKEVKEKKDK